MKKMLYQIKEKKKRINRRLSHFFPQIVLFEYVFYFLKSRDIKFF
jgi:hypothetical protein